MNVDKNYYLKNGFYDVKLREEHAFFATLLLLLLFEIAQTGSVG